MVHMLAVEATTKTAKEVEAVLEVLAAKFGSTVEALWGYIVAYQAGMAWVYLAAGIALLAAFFFPSYFAFRAARKVYLSETIKIKKRGKEEEGDWLHTFFGYLFASCIALTGFLVSLLALIIPALQRFASPEYMALRDIMGGMK